VTILNFSVLIASYSGKLRPRQMTANKQ